MSGFTRDGERRLRGHMPSKVSRGGWQKSGIVKRNGSGLDPSGFQPLLGHLLCSVSFFVFIVTVGIY